MCLMRTFSGNRFLQKCCWIWKSLPSTPTMFCVQLKPTNRLVLGKKKSLVIWVFSSSGNFLKKSARGLALKIPAQEDVDGKIWIVQLGHFFNSSDPLEPDFLKTRYLFINLGINENVVPSIIRNRKKLKTGLSSCRRLDSTTLCVDAVTKVCKKYEFRERKLLAPLSRQSPSKKRPTCPLREVNRFSGPWLEGLGFDV